MKIKQLIHSKYGKILLSIILGIGLAALFNTSCTSKSCYRYVAPHTSKVEQGIWQYNEQCYKYEPKIKTCNKSKKKIMRN